MVFTTLSQKLRQQKSHEMVGSSILFCSVFAVVFGCKAPELYNDSVKYIPYFEEEVAASVQCTAAEHKALYVINSWKNKTSLWCSCDVEIYGGFCPEVNIGDKIRFQENYHAPCHNLSRKPCPHKYKASESYKYRGCFEKFGGILSPKSLVIKNERLEGTIQKLKRSHDYCENHLSQQNRRIIENNKDIEFLNNKVLKQQEAYNQMKENYNQMKDTVSILSIFIVLIFCLCLYLNWGKVKDFFHHKLNCCKKDQTSNSEQNEAMLPVIQRDEAENSTVPMDTNDSTDAKDKNVGAQDENESVPIQDGYTSDHIDVEDENDTSCTDALQDENDINIGSTQITQ